MELSSTRGMGITSRVQGPSFIIAEIFNVIAVNDPALNLASLLESYMSLYATNELSHNGIPCTSLMASDYR